jgi:beta-lactamase class A
MGLKKIAALVVAAVLLFGLGFWAHGQFAKPSTENSAYARQADYPMMASRIFLSRPNDVLINFVNMRQQLGKYFTDNNLSGSLYFQYLPTGTSVQTVNKEEDVAASLMKLPTAMDAYKAVENGKADLDKVITLDQSMLDSSYGTLYQKGAGYKLTLREAISIMLEQSDNTALNAVLSVTDGLVPPAANSLNAVDVSYTTNSDQSVSISAKSYSSILSCLYFSCYNTYEDSQKILGMLTHCDFTDRLVAGVGDKKIIVAHKIGVFGDLSQSDCGIVYVPKRPYLACIMLDGPDNATTSEHIASMSKIIYDYVTTYK